MSIYAIGDVQGGYDELQRLLNTIQYEPTRDTLWFVGDLVNRGPGSLACLRFIESLGDKAIAVLGNHDLHLLVVAEGLARPHRTDTLDEILRAPDRDELLHWLRHRPLLHRTADCLMVHAGLLPGWTPDKAAQLAREIESALRGQEYRDFLAGMYGNQPDAWSDDLAGLDRLRIITNALTRLRFCTPDGRMEFAAKGGLNDAPEGYLPWFEVPHRKSAQTTIVCGHWASLGLMVRKDLIALDTGCVWGRKLTAIRLQDRSVFQVSCASSSA